MYGICAVSCSGDDLAEKFGAAITRGKNTVRIGSQMFIGDQKTCFIHFYNTFEHFRIR